MLSSIRLDTNITPNLLNNSPNINPLIVKIILSKIIIVDNCNLEAPKVLIRAISYFLSLIELNKLMNKLKPETIIIKYAK